MPINTTALFPLGTSRRRKEDAYRAAVAAAELAAAEFLVAAMPRLTPIGPKNPGSYTFSLADAGSGQVFITQPGEVTLRFSYLLKPLWTSALKLNWPDELPFEGCHTDDPDELEPGSYQAWADGDATDELTVYDDGLADLAMEDVDLGFAALVLSELQALFEEFQVARCAKCRNPRSLHGGRPTSMVCGQYSPTSSVQASVPAPAGAALGEAQWDDYPVREPDDPVKRDLELVHTACGAVICDIQDQDTLITLAGCAADHDLTCAQSAD